MTVYAERGGHALQGWSPLQAPVRLANAGVDTCTAANITAHSHTPVLTLCRKMIAAGIDPATELQVFRGDTLALTFRNIGEAEKSRCGKAEATVAHAISPLSDDGWPRKRFPELPGTQ